MESKMNEYDMKIVYVKLYIKLNHFKQLNQTGKQTNFKPATIFYNSYSIFVCQIKYIHNDTINGQLMFNRIETV